MSVLSCARSGRFSSDRAIREYCERIWHVRPVPVRLLHRADGELTPTPRRSPVR
jgi:starch phosphorylase